MGWAALVGAVYVAKIFFCKQASVSGNILSERDSTWRLSIFKGRTIENGGTPKSLRHTFSFLFKPFFKPGTTTKEGDAIAVIVTTREFWWL